MGSRSKLHVRFYDHDPSQMEKHLIIHDDISLTNLDRCDFYHFIRYRLPFRMRIGRLLTVQDPEHADLTTFIFNEFDSVTDTPFINSMPGDPLRHLRSQILVTERVDRTSQRVVAEVRKAVSDGNTDCLPDVPNFGRHQKVADDIVNAYAVQTDRTRIEAARGWIAESSYDLYLKEIEGHLVLPAGRSVVASIDDSFFSPSLKPRHVGVSHVESLTTPEVAGYPAILDSNAISRLSRTFTDVRSMAFLRLSIKAKRHDLMGDYVTALLLACAACEGAAQRLAATLIRDALDHDKKLAADLAQRGGMNLLLRLIQWQLLDSQARPSSDRFNSCIAGFAMRNKIMHHNDKGNGILAENVGLPDMRRHFGGVYGYYMALQKLIVPDLDIREAYDREDALRP
jgi:hypothetical protein